ncbi:MAG: hypothetical protein QW292_06305, partial [Candidatus Parvarchaeota archaeon]
MFKPNNKKMLTVLLVVAMIFSAFAILSLAAQPAYAQTASGTVTYTPNIITAGQVLGSRGYLPVIQASGGTFSSVTEFYFYWSTTNSIAGLLGAQTPGTATGTVTTTSFSVTASAPTYETDTVTFTVTSGNTVQSITSVALTALSPATVSSVTIIGFSQSTNSQSTNTVTVKISFIIESARSPATLSSTASVDYVYSSSGASANPSFYYKPGAGTTTFTNALLVPISPPPSLPTPFSGETLYLLASTSSTLSPGSSGVSVMGSTPFTVSQYNPTITLAPSTVGAGHYTKVSGSGFNPAATSANVYLAEDGVAPVSLGTVSLSAGSVSVNQYISAPTNVPYGTYDVYAVDSVSGEDAGTQATISEAIIVSPLSISGSVSSAFTISGFGFPAGSVISAGTTTVSLTGPGLAGGIVSTSVTVSSNGQFTLPISGLTASLSTHPGAYTISITLTALPAGYTGLVTPSFPNAIYVSVPGVSPTLTVTDLITTNSAGYAGDPMEIVGTGFLASQPATVYFDGATYTGTTDVNGFFEIKGSTVVVPNLPAARYNVFADVGGLTANTTFTISTQYFFEDSSFASLDGEYASSGSVVYVVLMGLTPYEAVNVKDTGLHLFGAPWLGTVNFYYGNVKVNDGTYNASTGLFYANGEGYLNISYSLHYKPSTPTGTRETISAYDNVTQSAISGANATYYTVGTAFDSYASSGSSLGVASVSSAPPGASVTLSFPGLKSEVALVPTGASTTPEAA